MIRLLTLTLLLTLTPLSASENEKDWGRTGHRATGEVATSYLSNKAKREISKLLDEHRLL